MAQSVFVSVRVFVLFTTLARVPAQSLLTMLLTITNTKSPATDLGYLLHPNRSQSSELSGKHMCSTRRRQPNAAPLRFCWMLTPLDSSGLAVGRLARAGCSINTWTDLAHRNGSLGPQQILKKALVVPPNPRRVAA
jgi:hypothetical protein